MPRQRLSEKVAELETRLWGVEQVQQEHMQHIPDLALTLAEIRTRLAQCESSITGMQQVVDALVRTLRASTTNGA